MLLLLLLQVADLGDPDPAVRERATYALRNAGARAVPALVEALTSEDVEVATRANGLLDRLADAAGLAGLCVQCEEVSADATRARGIIRVTNRGRLPVRVDRAQVGLENFTLDRPADGSIRLLPGESLVVPFSGSLMPECPRPVVRSREGASVFGDAVHVAAPGGPNVRVFKLVNAQAQSMARILQELFRPTADASPVPEEDQVEVAYNPYTNLVVIKASARNLVIIRGVIEHLDADPAKR